MQDFSRWEERYRQNETPWDTGLPSSELMRVLAARRIGPCRVLELGCGTGTNVVWLAEQGFDAMGVDVSPRAIEAARHRAAEAGVSPHFMAGNLLTLEGLGEPFDLLFDRGCYHAVRRDDCDGYLRTADRWTRPGALALVLTGNARQEGQDGPPRVTEEELRTELGRVFEVIDLREMHFDRSPQDGKRYLGWSFLGRKPGGA